MSDLSTDIPQPDHQGFEPEKNSHPGVMLVTMLLLTAALGLTGTMMLDYAKSRGAFARTDDGTSETEISPAASLLKSFEKSTAQEAEQETAVEETDNGSPISDLFGNRDGTVRWPKLELTGFGVSPNGNDSFAIINEHLYHPGQKINGKVMLVEIQSHAVKVEYQGETRMLTVDTQR